jgi:hypothetical protein
MKKIVIYGAYDRYNYGDNLMPLLFELFLEKYYPDVVSAHDLVFASISKSDLSNYKAKKTQAIYTILNDKSASDIVAIIVIGGEVLGAKSSTLFTHMSHPFGVNYFIKNLARVMPKMADRISKLFYPVPWDLPYIPDKRNLPNNVKVLFNTVGGDLRKLSSVDKKIATRSLSQADYISARDVRTEEGLKELNNIKRYPDSVCAIADLVDSDFISKNTRPDLLKKLDVEYICFQAAPLKVGAEPAVVARILEEISHKLNMKIVLLPIGYAAGHDDYELLEKIRNYAPDIFSIHYELNVWEIMQFIKQSRVFMGTSLHGCITALSFGVCSVGVNPKINKLDEFLKCWGVDIINRCYTIESIPANIEAIMSIERSTLFKNAEVIKSLALQNNNDLVKSLAGI